MMNLEKLEEKGEQNNMFSMVYYTEILYILHLLYGERLYINFCAVIASNKI